MRTILHSKSSRAAVVLAICTLVSPGLMAVTAVDEDHYVPDVSVESPLGGERRSYSPAGCAGQTDNVHKSSHYASVHGRTKCASFVGQVGVTTIVQKKGWVGWQSMLSDSSSRSNSRNSQDAHPHWNCSGWGTQLYRGASAHFSVEGSGTYYANTVGTSHGFSC